MLTDAFKRAVVILETIESNGYEAYFVGGCVRDFLLKRKIKDIDIASSAPPTVIQQLFDKVIPVGIDHGTVIVRYEGISYEITTFRQDGTYSDQRHPDDVTFISTIEEDLKRRDFTMNAIAMDKNGAMIDLFEGKSDLKKQIIRSVGDAKKRFKEDPLRIIRALRFSSQLGFSIETNTLAQMKQLNKEVETVAIERLTNEWTKLFQGTFVQHSIAYVIDIEIDQYMPIFKENRSLLHNLPHPLTPFHSFADVIAFFHYLDPSIHIQTWTKEWKCSNDIKNKAINLYDALIYYEENGVDNLLVYRLQQAYFRPFLQLLKVIWKDTESTLTLLQNKKECLAIQSRNELAIDGHDVMKMFPNKKRGPWMNRIIEQVEQEIVFNRLHNTKIAIKEWIRCHPPEIN